MGQVMIRCPKTKHKVATGLEMDSSEFSATKDMGGSLKCPECGKTHHWTKDQAELVRRVAP